MIKVEGKKIAENLKEEVRNLLIKNPEKNSLVIFYVGQNDTIDKYVNLKKKVGEELGIKVDVKRFPSDIKEETLIEEIGACVKDYSGAIVQLPLPPHLDKRKIVDLVPADKDVDMLSIKAFEDFKNKKTEKLPTVVSAIDKIVRDYDIDLEDKNIVVIGRGSLVGGPVSTWLTRQGFAHQVLDDKSLDFVNTLKDADVIISGTGEGGLIKKDMVKEGVIIFDAGTSTSSGKIAGDVDVSAYEKASIITPVPGGIGPITVVSLFKNMFLN